MQHSDVLHLRKIIQTGPVATTLIIVVYFSISHRKQPKDRNFWTQAPTNIPSIINLMTICFFLHEQQTAFSRIAVLFCKEYIYNTMI